MSRVFINSWRFTWLALAVVLGFSAVLGRLYFLHVVEAEELRQHVDASRKMTITLGARRGDITDVRGNLLATTRPRVDLGIDPHVAARHSDPVDWGRLANMLGISQAEMEAALARTTRVGSDGSIRPVRWVKLAEIGPELNTEIAALRFPGVYGNLHYERYYPGGSLAAHLLGFVNREGTPVLGVEHFMDYYLRGQDGWKETEADARRREMAQFREREVDPRDGYRVQLTIDMVVQNYVEQAIERLVEQYDPEGVTIIVSDPMTGEILALGNYPTFDPNAFWEAPIGNQRNRAATDLYEPGSTFKIVPVAAALEERLVQPNTIIDCETPVVEYRGRNIRLPNDTRNLGHISLVETVARSSNRGAAQLGMMLGEDRLYAYAANFGFGSQTNWGLLGEARGTLHPVKAWDGLTISRLPAGYAMNATPLQVHYAMSALANGGVLMQPRVIRRISDRNGGTLLDFPVRERNRVVSEDTARTVAAMLARVATTEGTARRAAIPGYEVAGKTGTARKIINGQYSQRHHVASFSGFFPARAPRVAITVVIDDAKLSGTAYGGSVAAPVFREIGERLIDYYALSPVPEGGPSPLYAFLKKD